MTPAGIEPATFPFVAQHLNHCATAVPGLTRVLYNIILVALAKSRLLKRLVATK